MSDTFRHVPPAVRSGWIDRPRLAGLLGRRPGELLLARGEPEEATAWAGTVLRYEPLLERAHRLLVRSLAGQGNRPAALTAAQDLAALLTVEGLTPEPESQRLIESLGGTPPR